MVEPTGEFVKNITEEIPGVVNTLDPYLNSLGVDNQYLQAFIILLFFKFDFHILRISRRNIAEVFDAFLVGPGINISIKGRNQQSTEKNG